MPCPLALSGLGGGTVVVTTEMAYRLRLWGATATFEVRDWIDEAKWVVTITGSSRCTRCRRLDL